MKTYDLRSSARAVATRKSNREGVPYYVVREVKGCNTIGWTVLDKVQYQLFIEEGVKNATEGDHVYGIIREK